jgi:predicted SprT family Zn-dependent metalloprotease
MNKDFGLAPRIFVVSLFEAGCVLQLPGAEELYNLYDRFNEQYFERKLPPSRRVTIAYSNRLTTSAGICYPKQHTIRLSTYYHLKYPEEIKATLLHEMIHLLVPGHGAGFKAWVLRIRACGGRVELHAKERAVIKPARWRYLCRGCGREYLRRNRLKHGGGRHLCGGCRGKLREQRLP